MKKLSLEELKKEELNILTTFNKFCQQHALRFYLAGGTLLGAIRHKGFIPWDDDIDVCMPRPDYEKLIQLYDNTDSRYQLRCIEKNNFSAPYAKMVDINTHIKEKYLATDDNKNLWIDIFPVDGLPEDLSKVKKIYKSCDFYRTIYLLNFANLGEGRSCFRKYMKYLLKPIAMLYGKKRCVHKIQDIAKQYKYKNSKYVGAVTWGLYGDGERMLKSEFEKAVKVEFEGEMYPAFSCWDSYLAGLYHDYMTLPPESERRSHDIMVYMDD